MLPKKSVQREGGGKKDTTAAVLRYRDTADASHTKGVDEEVDGFIIIDGPGDEEFVVVDTPNSRLLGHTGAHRNDSRPQNSMLEKGTSSPDKIASTVSEQLIVGAGEVCSDIICYPAGSQLLLNR